MSQNSKTLLHTLEEKMKDAFAKADLPFDHVAVQQSDRPDLADFQCNSAFSLSKELKQNPRVIAEKVVSTLDKAYFEKVEVAGPGFINLVLKNDFLASFADAFKKDERASCSRVEKEETFVIDYGGPNVAKPLHVGHLRPAIIGEAIKRALRFAGHYVIGDVHLGDWGTPMGMLIAELEERHPEWPYFDASQTSFPKDSPISVDALNVLYPEASTHFKTDEAFADKARTATAKLQDGTHAGYRALWKHFTTLSIDAMKEDYERLNVEFDLWLGESDAHDFIPPMIAEFKEKNLVVESDGALIVHVARETDKEEIPPLILVKKDGGYNYATTDLATLYDRLKKYNPHSVVYVVDTRQSLHFKQVFRVAEMANYFKPSALVHANFGTINGKDGKPFKTRDGGVMRLSGLIDLAKEEALKQAGFASEDDLNAEMKQMIESIAVAAIKYGDLAVNRQSDYIFDVQSFVQTEGKTGPYIQYAAVRIKAILEKAGAFNRDVALQVTDEAEKELLLQYLNFTHALHKATETHMPSVLCDHVYLLAKSFSRFYKNCPVNNCEDEKLRSSRLLLCEMVLRQIEIVMKDILSIQIPQKMLRKEDLENAA